VVRGRQKEIARRTRVSRRSFSVGTLAVRWSAMEDAYSFSVAVIGCRGGIRRNQARIRGVSYSVVSWKDLLWKVVRGEKRIKLADA